MLDMVNVYVRLRRSFQHRQKVTLLFIYLFIYYGFVLKVHRYNMLLYTNKLDDIVQIIAEKASAQDESSTGVSLTPQHCFNLTIEPPQFNQGHPITFSLLALATVNHGFSLQPPTACHIRMGDTELVWKLAKQTTSSNEIKNTSLI
jgi:hypothetical protein